MAGIEGFENKVKGYILKRIGKIEERTTEALAYTGEEFAKKAKVNGSYKDRTSNLRSSIGYIVQKDGRIQKESFEGEKPEGAQEGQAFAHRLSPLLSKGHILIGVAGMRYARHVEDKNYDVISGSAPDKNEFKEMIKTILSK